MRLSPARIVAAIVIASLITPLFLACFFLSEKIANPRLLVNLGIVLATSPALWLPAAVSLGWFYRDKHRVPPHAWMAIGAVVTFLYPALVVAVAQYGFQRVGVGASPASFPAGAIVLLGLWQMPLGLFTGWLVWRVMLPPQVANWENLYARLWSNVSRRRVIPSLLLLAPIPAAPVLYVLLATAEEMSSPWPQSKVVAWVSGAALALAAGVGGIVLHTAARGSDRISRANCLFAGCAVAFLLPATVLLTAALVPEHSGLVGVFAKALLTGDRLHDVAFVTFNGLGVMPFGIPGGWLLWRLAIAPGERPIPAHHRTQAVFD